MAEKKKLSKKTIYTIFILKFIFSLVLIFWTVYLVVGAGVGKDDDNTFMSTYHKVDDDYNKIVASNNLFNQYYDIQLIINNRQLNNISYKDIFLSQRAVNARKEKKNILKVGKNSIKIILKDKKTDKIIDNIDARIVFTMALTHKYDVKLELNQSNQEKNFNIQKKSYWNIMGIIKVNGYTKNFFIKTNAK